MYYKKILFATTASPACDNAAKVAFDMAMKYDAELVVFHVLGVPTRGFSTQVTDVKTGELEEMYDENYVALVKEEIKSYYEELSDQVNVRIETGVGVPYREILRQARAEDADLIIMGSNTRAEDVSSTRYRGVAGETLRKVAKRARCPVAIISRPCTTCWKLFSNIVVATDFSKASDSAFMYAMKSAEAVGARLYIFHAYDLSASYAGGKAPTQGEIEQRVKEAEQKIKERYLSKMDGFDNYEVAIWEGTPYVEILKYARAKQADLIVMAHHAREYSNPDEAEFGSTVEEVVLRAPCPVASVNHPDKVAD
ncbi:universal stress protein [Paucidesulfovibrio longus]|uniref:universal stress protein n=1 Tax=Paucidesulfovibrio longus TaxID=889 RepID=UPI0003B736E6|nr:universal stress protein [Paucidesulfovibrio longus]